jgi:hypothetical protein
VADISPSARGKSINFGSSVSSFRGTAFQAVSFAQGLWRLSVQGRSQRWVSSSLALEPWVFGFVVAALQLVCMSWSVAFVLGGCELLASMNAVAHASEDISHNVPLRCAVAPL